MTWLLSSLVSVKQNPCFLPETAPGSAMPDGIMHNGSSSGIINGTPSGNQLLNASKDLHGLHNGIDASTSLQSDQNATTVLYGVDNETSATIKTESCYSSNADFAFCGNTFLESCQSIGDASGGGSFSSSELNGQPLNESILDMESSSFSFLNQMPQNFIFSDLADDFNQSAGTFQWDLLNSSEFWVPTCFCLPPLLYKLLVLFWSFSRNNTISHSWNKFLRFDGGRTYRWFILPFFSPPPHEYNICCILWSSRIVPE